jgi:MinD-like ATPase involved in chromosome partitioning or flagellar assembly
MASKRGRIITVFSTKGGVGKTILTLNLAGLFHLENKKVLIIDLDLYSGGIAVSLNVNVSKDIYNLVDDLVNNRFSDFKDYITKYNDNIDVLSCPIDPRKGSKIESKLVDVVLTNAASRYDIILVDTSHILNDISLTALDKAHDIIMVLSNDPIDLKNMRSIVSIFKSSGIDNYYVILNEAINTDKDFFSYLDIKEIIGRPLDYTISRQFHFTNIDKFVLDGEIPVLNKKVRLKKKDDVDKLKKLVKRLMSTKDGDDFYE